MFELPEAKRVRREDLNGSDDGSAGSDSEDGGQNAELRAKLNAQIARTLGLDDTFSQPPSDLATGNSHLAGPKASGDDATGGPDSPDLEGDVAMEEDGDSDGNEEFAFRLFSGAPAAQKVVLEEDVEPQGDGGLMTGRPLSYYVVTDLSSQQKQEFAFAAVAGEDVLARSNDRAWGLELPWKVTRITVTRKRKPGETTTEAASDEEARKKRRPGKKQRISLRKRAKVKEEKNRAEEQRLVEKEEHVKDKKKRMNRLKKLRKRAKAREQKQAAKGEDEESVGSE